MSVIRPYIPNTESQLDLNNMANVFSMIDAELDSLTNKIETLTQENSELKQEIENLKAE